MEDEDKQIYQRIMALSLLKDEICEIRNENAELTESTVRRTTEISKEMDEIMQKNRHRDMDKDEAQISVTLTEEVLSCYSDGLPRVKCLTSFNIDAVFNKLEVLVQTDGYEVFNLRGILRPCVSLTGVNLRPDLLAGDPEQSQQDPVKERNRRAPRPKEVVPQASQPSRVEETCTKDAQAVHSRKVHKVMRHLYRESMKPLDYWSLVIDPTSFNATLMNMFSVSLLVQSGKARVDSKVSEQKLLVPLSDGEAAAIKQNEKSQIIVSLSPPIYRDLIEKLNITTPRIPSPE